MFIQAKLDFSICIFESSFFNGFTTAEQNEFSENPLSAQPSAFSSGQFRFLARSSLVFQMEKQKTFTCDQSDGTMQ